MTTMMLELAALSLLARQEQSALVPQHWTLLPREVRCALTGPRWLNADEVRLLIDCSLAWTLDGVPERDILAELRRLLWERATAVHPHHVTNTWIPVKVQSHGRALMALLEPGTCTPDHDEHAVLPERRRPEMRRALEQLGLLRPDIVVIREEQPIQS